MNSLSFLGQQAALGVLKSASEGIATAQKRVASGRAILGAADDSARYRMSGLMLGMARAKESLNNNLGLALAAIETADRTLTGMIDYAEEALAIARDAQAESQAPYRGIYATSDINENSVIAGAAIGARISITSDSGMNFTYVITRAGTTWGEIANQLNAANIGVKADFLPSQTPGQTNIRFMSTNGLDFTFDGISDQTIMDDLATASFVANSTNQAMTNVGMANTLFGAAGIASSGETGLTIAFGGAVTGTQNVVLSTSFATASTLVIDDGESLPKTFDFAAGDTIEDVISRINSAGFTFRAELSNADSAGGNDQFRIRNVRGGQVHVRHASGEFAAGGQVGLVGAAGFASAYNVPLRLDSRLRLLQGTQFDHAVASMARLAQNAPAPPGRNLVAGQNLAVRVDEHSTQSLFIAGVNLTSLASLGIVQGGTAWIATSAIQTSINEVQGAIGTLRSYQAQFATFASYLKARYDLNRSVSTELEVAGNEIVGADVAEESARMTALRTRQDFAVQALTMGASQGRSLVALLN
jgi:flagellin-like hook-associated protein FlgL